MQHEFDHLDGVLYVDRLGDGDWKTVQKIARKRGWGRPGAVLDARASTTSTPEAAPSARAGNVEAIKLQSGAYWDSPGPAAMSNAFERDLNFILSREGDTTFITDQAWTLVRDGATISGVDAGRVPVTLRDIVFTDETGVTVTGRFNYLEFTGFDGQPKAAWLLDSIRE